MKKWETILKNCAEAAFNQVRGAHSVPNELGALITLVSLRVTLAQGYRESRQHDKVRVQLQNMVYNCIMNWDIRSFESLRTMYPKKFPTGELVTEMQDDENATWVILKKYPISRKLEEFTH